MRYSTSCIHVAVWHFFIADSAATQDSTGDSVTDFAGPAAAAVPVQDAVELVVEGPVHGQRTGCRMLAVQIGAG